MPAVYEADITEIVEPYYKKGKLEGRLEGKLEDARRMKELGADIDFICKATGLSLGQLKEAGVLES